MVVVVVVVVVGETGSQHLKPDSEAHFDRVCNDTAAQREYLNDCAEEARKTSAQTSEVKNIRKKQEAKPRRYSFCSPCFQIPQRLSCICTSASESRPRRLPSSTPPFSLHSPRFVKTQLSFSILPAATPPSPLPGPGGKSIRRLDGSLATY